MTDTDKSLMDSIVVDWRESLPAGADGIYTINGLTAEELKAIQDKHPELSLADIILRLSHLGYAVSYFPISKDKA